MNYVVGYVVGVGSWFRGKGGRIEDLKSVFDILLDSMKANSTAESRVSL